MERVTLDTDRLVLRRWRDEDIAPLAAINADPDVMQFICDGSPRSVEQTRLAVAHFEREWEVRGFGLFAVELKRTRELIGFTGFSWPDFLPEILPSVEIGWRLAKAQWGNGYATEAAEKALSFGIVTLGLTDIVSIGQAGNSASIRIMQKLGLRHDRRTLDTTCNREVEVYRWVA